jgi:hypothetical protein
MRAMHWTTAALLLVAVPALAQTMSPPPGILGTLPLGATTAADADAPRELLLAARQALAAGRLVDAREALEQAETRVLTRSVLASLRQKPSSQSLVAVIDDARAALAAADRSTTLEKIDEALRSPDLDEPAL